MSQPRGHQQAAHDAHRRHQPLREPRPPAALPDPCGPEHRSATGGVDDQPGEMARPPMKEGTGQSTLRLPVARTESRLSARAPDPPPLAQNDATSLRTSPGKITNDPAEIVNTNRPDNRQRSRRTQPTARTTPTQKSGLNQMLKTPRQAPKDRPAMSKPTTYNSNPVKSGEVTETRQTIKRGLRKYHPHQRRQPQTPTTTGDPPPGFPARACPRPTGSSARGWRTTTATAPIRETRRKGPETLRQHPRGPEPPARARGATP